MSDKIKFSETDTKMKQMISRKGNLSESRIRTYDKVFLEIYEEIESITPTELINLAKKEEKPYIGEDGIIDIKDIDDRTITKIQYEYEAKLRSKKVKGRPLSERTLDLKLGTYRSFLKEYDIQLPKPINFNTKKPRVRDSEIPSWTDVQKAMTLAKSPRDKTIIAFAATTGFRVSDILNFKLKDLIEACSIYFKDNEEKTLINLLNKNPDNIIPNWIKIGQKTEKYKTITITFNTPETTNFLFDYLKYRFKLNDKSTKDNEIDIEEPLFISQRGGFLNPVSIEQHFSEINKKMGGKKDRNGIYGKFRIHNLRALFQTTCRRNLPNVYIQSNKTFKGDIVNLFTGHNTKDNPLNYAYESIPEDSHESYIRKAYEALIPYLSIQPTEVKDFKTEDYQKWEEEKNAMIEQMNAQDANHQRDLEEKDKEIINLKKQIEKTNIKVDETSKAMEEFKLRKTSINIRNFIIDYCKDNYHTDDLNKYNLICLLAIKYANENKEEFEFNNNHVSTLIKKMEIKVSLSKESIMEQYVALGVNMIANEEHNSLSHAVNDIMSIIMENEQIMSIIDDFDALKLGDLLELYLIESDYDLDNLSEDNKLEIADKALMDYL